MSKRWIFLPEVSRALSSTYLYFHAPFLDARRKRSHTSLAWYKFPDVSPTISNRNLNPLLSRCVYLGWFHRAGGGLSRVALSRSLPSFLTPQDGIVAAVHCLSRRPFQLLFRCTWEWHVEIVRKGCFLICLMIYREDLHYCIGLIANGRKIVRVNYNYK